MNRVVIIVTCAAYSVAVQSEDQFDPAFLSGDPSTVADLAKFQSGQQLPGTYLVEVFLNGEFVETKEITFSTLGEGQTGSDGTGLSPVLSLDYLKQLGLNVAAVPALSNPDRQEAPVDLAVEIPAAATFFNFERQRLELNLPQAVLYQQVRGLVPESLWDDGITALLLNYNLSGDYGVNGADKGDNSNFLGLNSGLNMGAWRFRSYSTWNKGSGIDEWQHVNASLSRGLTAYKSRLLLGDSYTPSDMFDSLSFRGMQLTSDDEMYPDSLRGYAPTIHGIAKSNAKVTIKQNDYLIYQTQVSPGAFVISDLYASTNSGDLLVEVEESDGTVNRYTVPFAAIPLLLREDRVKYGLTLGRYRSGSDAQQDPQFAQGSLAMGLANDLTLYGGSQLSGDYQSAAFGIGKNLGVLGALSTDVTHAKASLPDGSEPSGQSLSLAYAKGFDRLGFTIRTLGVTYSTEGYHSFADSTNESMTGSITPSPDTQGNGSLPFNLNYAKSSRVEGSVSQELGASGGSLFLSAWQQSYWHTDLQDVTLQFGYSGVWRALSYNLAYNYSDSLSQTGTNQIVSMNLSLPLRWGNDDTPLYVNYGINHDADGQTTHSLGVSGTALEDNNLSYSLQQGFRTGEENATSSNASLNYKGARSTLRIGYSADDNRQQLIYGAAGGLVVHGDGVTLSQPLGNSNVLVAAPGAEGVEIENTPGSRTDASGYAVVPYATNYKYNRIELDATALPDNLEIDEAVAQVVPTSGALVRADFTARIGVRALLTLTNAGQPLPFGADVSANGGAATGIVAEEGVVYLSGLEAQGELRVRWGQGEDQQCVAPYQLPTDAQSQPITRLALECR